MTVGELVEVVQRLGTPDAEVVVSHTVWDSSKAEDSSAFTQTQYPIEHVVQQHDGPIVLMIIS